MGRSSIDLYANDIGVPFVEIKSFAAYVGGCPTNIAVGARRLGLKTALLTAVGEDLVGDFILHFLTAEGVDTRYIQRKPGARTSAVLLGIEPPESYPMVFYRDNAADNQLTIDDVASSPVMDCTIFLATGTGLCREPSCSATLYAAEQARSAGGKVFLDLDLRPDQWPDLRTYGALARSLLPQVDVAIGTEEEVKAAIQPDARQVSSNLSRFADLGVSGDLTDAIHRMLEFDLEALVVKRGAQGATVYPRSGGTIHAPGFPAQVQNTLGAGDAFASGLIYGYLKGWDWYQAARMGNANGALVVARHGCANFMGYEDEVLQFITDQGGF